jgi:ATP-dependent DNA helicase RecG
MYDKKLQTPLQFLKGVGEKRATLFAEELNIASYEDLLHYYPFRYLDRSRFYTINEITAAPTLVQIKGRFISSQIIGTGNKRRLSAIYN